MVGSQLVSIDKFMMVNMTDGSTPSRRTMEDTVADLVVAAIVVMVLVVAAVDMAEDSLVVMGLDRAVAMTQCQVLVVAFTTSIGTVKSLKSL